MVETRSNTASEDLQGQGIAANIRRYIAAPDGQPNMTALANGDQLLPHNMLFGASSAFLCYRDNVTATNWPNSNTSSLPLWNGGNARNIVRGIFTLAQTRKSLEGTWGIFPDAPFSQFASAANQAAANQSWPTQFQNGFFVICFPIGSSLFADVLSPAAPGFPFAQDTHQKPNIFHTVSYGEYYTKSPEARYNEEPGAPIDGREGCEVSWWDGDNTNTISAVSNGATTVLTAAGHGWGSGADGADTPNHYFTIWIRGMTSNGATRCNGRFLARRVNANTFQVLNDNGTALNTTGQTWTRTAATTAYRAYEPTGFAFIALCFGTRRGAVRFRRDGVLSNPIELRTLENTELAQSILGGGGHQNRDA